MRTCVLQCCLTLLGLSLVLCSNGVSSQPDLDLRHRRLLQRVQALGVAAQVRLHEHWRTQKTPLHANIRLLFLVVIGCRGPALYLLLITYYMRIS